MPYGLILNLIILIAFILAFIKAQKLTTQMILAGIMTLIIFLPQLINIEPASLMWWVHYAGKVVFGLFCLIFVKLR